MTLRDGYIGTQKHHKNFSPAGKLGQKTTAYGSRHNETWRSEVRVVVHSTNLLMRPNTRRCNLHPFYTQNLQQEISCSVHLRFWRLRSGTKFERHQENLYRTPPPRHATPRSTPATPGGWNSRHFRGRGGKRDSDTKPEIGYQHKKLNYMGVYGI